jgi:ABC-type dipeptide/oligopeptide/nickel transport system ATPase component
MAFCDFVIKYDPSKDKPEDLSRKIIYSIIVKRLKGKKPAVVFLSGDSGEGKSVTGLELMKLILESQGVELKDHLNDVNIYTPLEYPTKLDNLLYKKELKNVNVMCIHEAREIVKAKLWHSFINQAIADVNAMSRSVKRLCTIIVSQFIRDISTDIRYTLTYYCKVSRPIGKKARLYIYVMWKDDRDLEKPKLRKRKLSGYLVMPNGKYRRFVPKYIEITPPDKAITDAFDAADTEAKSSIIKRKLKKLMAEMKLEAGEENNKVSNMVDFYLGKDNYESLHMIGKRVRGKWRLKSDFKDMQELSKDEVYRFENAVNLKLKERGLLNAEDNGEFDE